LLKINFFDKIAALIQYMGDLYTVPIELLLEILAGIFIFSFLIQLGYFLFVYLRLPLHKPRKPSSDEQHPVSVIICARNEENNLREFLPSVLTQTYPNYEVIVVNDCSEDQTETLLAELMQQHPHLRTTQIRKDAKFSHGKKLAMTIGIKAARYDHLLFTDADCRPCSDQWIATMMKGFDQQKELVLGYGGYLQDKGILNNLIRYESMYTGLQYLSFALAGIPYMGVGRNLSYKKSLFFNNKGFASHLHLQSGDDDLFVHQVATKKNTALEFSPEAHTRSKASSTFKAWFDQKRRHLSTGLHYRGKVKLLLFLELLTRYLLIGSFVPLLVQGFHPEYIIPAFAFRWLLFMILIKLTMKRLNETNLLLPSLVYDIFIPMFHLAAIISNIVLSKKNKWK
jgi:poly-beta-1,6-N-acetyl-D-glucosamine synthase